MFLVLTELLRADSSLHSLSRSGCSRCPPVFSCSYRCFYCRGLGQVLSETQDGAGSSLPLVEVNQATLAWSFGKLSRAGHVLFLGFALALLLSWGKLFVLALSCTFFGHKFCAFAFPLPRSSLFSHSLIFRAPFFCSSVFRARTFALLDFCACASIYSQDRTARTGQPGQDTQSRTGRTGQTKQDR